MWLRLRFTVESAAKMKTGAENEVETQNELKAETEVEGEAVAAVSVECD